MLIQNYRDIFIRYLDQLKEEITAFNNEEDLWLIRGTINNPPGVLCVHLCGNLQHYIGAVIGNSGYIRNRDQEFKAKNIPKDELLRELENTRNAVLTAFDNIDDKDLAKMYPPLHYGENVNYSNALSRTASHLSYHVGQINYYRRTLANNKK
jgi:hypothetical protein